MVPNRVLAAKQVIDWLIQSGEKRAQKNGVDFFIFHPVVVIVSKFQACASLYLLMLHQWDLLVGCLGVFYNHS